MLNELLKPARWAWGVSWRAALDIACYALDKIIERTGDSSDTENDMYGFDLGDERVVSPFHDPIHDDENVV